VRVQHNPQTFGDKNNIFVCYGYFVFQWQEWYNFFYNETFINGEKEKESSTNGIS
jgi:hypothetical protein